ncbi:MAG: hypothetical protein JO100_05990 [Pseudonocardia sp.]|nr:hypothetical protein [Pseudonocardia sp.]
MTVTQPLPELDTVSGVTSRQVVAAIIKLIVNTIAQVIRRSAPPVGESCSRSAGGQLPGVLVPIAHLAVYPNKVTGQLWPHQYLKCQV